MNNISPNGLTRLKVFDNRLFFCNSVLQLGIEKGRYYKIPRHLILCENCGVVDDEAHFILYCTINDRLRTAFLDDFLHRSRINTLIDILNPSQHDFFLSNNVVLKVQKPEHGILNFVKISLSAQKLWPK
jgi:hypothetical protein